MHDGELAARRHRARQVRARIVELAREYKEACAQQQDAQQALWQVPRPDAAGRELLMHAEQRAWDAIKHRRAALFAALEELDIWEDED